ncbi:hypothetical protein ACFE04_024941 [Oxalis oulophora]
MNQRPQSPIVSNKDVNPNRSSLPDQATSRVAIEVNESGTPKENVDPVILAPELEPTPLEVTHLQEYLTQSLVVSEPESHVVVKINPELNKVSLVEEVASILGKTSFLRRGSHWRKRLRLIWKTTGVRKPPDSSDSWRSLLKLRPIFKPHVEYQLGAQKAFSFWFDPWVQGKALIDEFLDIEINESNVWREVTVADLWRHGTWLLPDPSTERIAIAWDAVQLVTGVNDNDDKIVWKPLKTGEYTIKSAQSTLRAPYLMKQKYKVFVFSKPSPPPGGGGMKKKSCMVDGGAKKRQLQSFQSP